MAEFNYDFLDPKKMAGGSGTFNFSTENSSTTSTNDSKALPEWNAFTTDLDPDKEIPNNAKSVHLKSVSDINKEYKNKIGDELTISNTKTSQMNNDDTKLKALQTEKEIAQNALKEAQNKFNDVVYGVYSQEVIQAQTKCEEAQREYMEAVQGSDNPEVQALRDQVLENENDIKSTEEFIKDYTVDIQKTENDIAANTNKINAKDTIITACKNKISELQSKLGKENDDTKKGTIQTQLTSVQAQLGREEGQKQTLNSIEKALKEKKKVLEEQKKAAQEKLVVLEREKVTLDKQIIATKDELVKKALNNFNQLRAEYHKKLKESEKEKSNAQKAIQDAQQKLSSIDAKIAQRESEIIQEKIAEKAKQNIQSGKTRTSGDVAISGNSSSVDSQAADNVKIEKLEKNVREAKEDLSKKEAQLISIYDGSFEELKKLKEKKDVNFNTFCDKLISGGQADVANELKSVKQNVDNLESNYLAKCKAVLQYESQIGTATQTSTNITQKITELESVQSTLNGTDKSGLKAEQQSELSNKITELSNELVRLKLEKENTDKLVNDAQTLQRLKAERDQAKKEYDEAEAQLTQKMQKVVISNPDISGLTSAMDKYNSSKTEYNNKFSSTTETLLGEINTAREKVNSLSQTLGAAESKKFASKYRFTNGSGGSIVELAKSYIGKNEADGSADMFWREQGVNSSSSRLPWCAAFVSYVLKKSGVDTGNAYTFSVSGLRQWGNSTGKYIDGSNANSSNIKPGDVVIWKGGYFSSHTGIVSAVYPDGTYDTVEGNSSNRVKENKGNGSTGRYKMARTTGFVSV